MIYEQLASAAMLFAEFHAGTKKSLLDFWLPLLEQPIKFVLIWYGGGGSDAWTPKPILGYTNHNEI